MLSLSDFHLLAHEYASLSIKDLVPILHIWQGHPFCSLSLTPAAPPAQKNNDTAPSRPAERSTPPSQHNASARSRCYFEGIFPSLQTVLYQIFSKELQIYKKLRIFKSFVHVKNIAHFSQVMEDNALKSNP